MGRIPLVTAQISSKVARSNGATVDTYASPEAFGAAQGRALQVVAGGVEKLAGAADEWKAKKRQETVVNNVAQSDFTRRELEVRNEVGPDGTGLQEKTLQAYDQFVDEKANAIDDPVARQQYRLQMAQQRNTISSRSTQQEFTLSATFSKQNADASLMALNNKIMADPSGFDEYVQQGNAVIDTRTELNANLRSAMKDKWRQDGAKARFVGMLESARTVADIDAISAEIVARPKTEKGGKDDYVGRDWTKELDPQAYTTLVNQMGAARSAIVTKADADARAALDTIEERAKSVTTLIPQDELRVVSGVVRQSQNPVTVARLARIVRDQDIIAEALKLPPAEQRAAINGAKGNPATAFPGLPGRISQAVNAASEKFGVSASYLAITTQREYGSNYRQAQGNANPKFTPIPLRNDVDLRNVRPDVAEAATVAGELFGAPLQITSGYRSQRKQNAIRFGKGRDPNRASVAKDSYHTHGSGLDISTVGMSEQDRAKLAGSLVDAGFTGIGEYDTHIHADMRDTVPESFGDKNGRTWGGWTYLSPGVAAAVKERGFASNARAVELKRAAPVQTFDQIDYGRGTDITKDDGRPTTSVVGVMQFTKGTFLETMKDGQTAAAIGVDISGMSDDQILELRKDPEISMMAGAALAAKNKKTIEGTIGRNINDAELYMGHFLGAGGAIALIKAKDQQPNASAADLLPQAAASNKPVFYQDGKALTVEQVYNRISSSFVSDPSRVSYDDVQTRQRVLDNTEKQLNDNPMQFASDTGTFDVPEFTTDNMAAYGASVKSVAGFYNIPLADMKVLSHDAVDTLKKSLDEGSADDALATLTAMQNMGADVARAALKQLGEKDSTLAYAGLMNLESGEAATASDIVRGQKRLTDDPDIKNQIGATEQELSTAFLTATGSSLGEVAPRMRDDIRKAALAHYVETAVSRGKGGTFDQDAFTNSVQAVMGGKDGNPAIGEVNGEPTVLPAGITADYMETALNKMTVADWTNMSEQGVPPRYVDGTVIDPKDLADEAKLRAIGRDKYKIQLDDGTFAVTGQQARQGRLEAYIFAPNIDALVAVHERAQPAENEPKAAPPEESGWFAPGTYAPGQNPMGQFDENGRWVSP